MPELTAGLDEARDFYLPAQPANPDLRESVSVWVSDDRGRFGLPRVCLEAMARSWDTHGLEVNLAFPGGRMLTERGPARRRPAAAADDVARTYAAGPLGFETVTPFETLKVHYDGEMAEGDVVEHARGVAPGRRRRVQFEVTCSMAVPPFIPGTMSADAQRRMSAGGDSAAMGGARYEQLFRCSGRLQAMGEEELTFTGTGLRVHRVGVRDTSSMTGHCWQSALFPSGRAFGYIHFPPGPGGTPGYNEGYLFDGTEMVPAEVTEAPWLHEFVPTGGACGCVLTTARGDEITIEGETWDSVCVPQGASMFGDWPHNGTARRFYHQGGARYRWDGEETFGMIERSLPLEQVRLP